MRLAAIALVIMLAGCASLDRQPPPIRGTGELVGPPHGWIDYCYRHGEDPACRLLRDEIEKERATQ